jgi:hypothetical protein
MPATFRHSAPSRVTRVYNAVTVKVWRSQTLEDEEAEMPSQLRGFLLPRPNDSVEFLLKLPVGVVAGPITVIEIDSPGLVAPPSGVISKREWSYLVRGLPQGSKVNTSTV